MLAQALRLETPPHAAIATALPLLMGGPRRLAHGVFSTLIKRGVTLPQAPTLPEPVRLRWRERTEAIAGGLAEPPPLDLTLREPTQTAHWAATLGGTSLMPGHIRLSRGTAIESLAGFREGEWWVQDLAATLPASLLGPGKGRRVLDLCAAPGGKTLQLAAAGWQVTALDISKRRLERLRDNLQRTRQEADVVVADALSWEPGARFDAILLDAPCTATGTCRRHPDVLHRISDRQIDEMAALQATLLDRAARWLAPGGTLVYAVCSLEAAEGEAHATPSDLEPSPIAATELPAFAPPTASGTVVTDASLLPQAGGMDGFFIARWSKPA